MLSYLHVKNIALIDELDLEFKEGLNIITGETGAGKSILIGSINAVLGNKIAKDFIKQGQDSAHIDLVFTDYNPMIDSVLESYDIEKDEQLLINRKIGDRSVFRINGQIVNSKVVRLISDILLDIHSQHEHQSLLDEKHHILMLDRFLGDQIKPVLNAYKEAYAEFHRIDRELKATAESQGTFLREIEFLEFEIADIESYDIDLESDLNLEKTFKKLQQSKAIIEALNIVTQNISDNNNASSMIDLLDMSLKALLSHDDEELQSIHKRLENIYFDLEDISHDITKYIDSFTIDPRELDELELRINALNKLRMKYDTDLEGILLLLQEKKETLHKLLNMDAYRQSLLKEQSQLKKTMEALANKLTELRQEGACGISVQIVDILSHLNLKDAKFEIEIKDKQTLSNDGKDLVRFMITTNKGQGLKPLKDVASGGEISRVMLAIKSVLADVDMIDTMIFDEIDSGISGMTAGLVGEKLYDVARRKQIIAITHLPQIGSMADHHFKVEKVSDDINTTVTCYELDNEKATQEIGRLLGGKIITDAVLKNASEMISIANQYKSER